MENQNNELNSIIQKNNENKPKKSGKGCLIFFISILIFLSVLLGLLNSFGKLQPPTTEVNKEENKNGEEYESVVFQAFWESASDFFKVEYSDYKMAHTAYSFISESTTTDGKTAYYYLIQTAFETKNVYGVKSLHKVTARCYYIPDDNSVYSTYITCDGEKVYYDGEKESWLLGLK